MKNSPYKNPDNLCKLIEFWKIQKAKGEKSEWCDKNIKELEYRLSKL